VDPTNRNTALASAMVEELARCGVRRAVVSPGSRSTPLALALWRQPSIEVEVVIDERSAGFFALGTALATGVPAAVVCTSGSAAANLHPAVVEADEAGVPLIVLTADRPPELRGIGAGQAIDQIKLYGDSPRWFCEVGTHDADDSGLLHFRSVACRAFAAASGSPRPGPVHLNVPWREPLAPVPVEGDVTATDPLALEGRGERPLNAVARAVPRADDALLDELAERLASAPRGLILAGRQRDPAAAEPVFALAAAAGYPVLAEPTSQMRWAHDPPSSIVTSYSEIARGRPEALEPELVIQVGELPTSKPLRQWLAAIEGLRAIVIDPDGAWKEPTRRAETLVHAEPASVAGGLAERLKAGAEARRSGEGAWLASWTRADSQIRELILDELSDTVSDLSEPEVWPSLAEVLRDGDQVFAASSMPVRDMEAFMLPGSKDVRFYANRGANGIDGLVSTASGLASSGARTFAVLGDLALAHDIGGLLVAARQDSLRLIVIDNGGGGIFSFLPQADVLGEDEFEAVLGTPSGVRPEDAARLYGMEPAVPENPAQFRDALRDDARFIVVRTDRAENLALHRRLSEVAAASLASALPR
jgi:2-succinyl-5-enolpyruvyl-6-hydroxy-3-cyclohexene-1-carboxylate synthase